MVDLIMVNPTVAMTVGISSVTCHQSSATFLLLMVMLLARMSLLLVSKLSRLAAFSCVAVLLILYCEVFLPNSDQRYLMIVMIAIPVREFCVRSATNFPRHPKGAVRGLRKTPRQASTSYRGKLTLRHSVVREPLHKEPESYSKCMQALWVCGLSGLCHNLLYVLSSSSSWQAQRANRLFS